MEDCDQISICLDVEATEVFKKKTDELKKILEEKEIASDIQNAIIGWLTIAWRGGNRRTITFGTTNFGDDLTLSGILRDQVGIGCLNFFSGRWRVKWREAQKRH